MSPCVTYNKHNTFAWFKENVFDVTQIEGYDNTNKQHAFEALTAEGKIPLGSSIRRSARRSTISSSG